MNCQICHGQMKITFTIGTHLLWKCPYCGYAEVVLSDKVNGQGSQSDIKTEGGREKKPAEGTRLPNRKKGSQV